MVHMLRHRPETMRTHIDLYQLLIGILALEIGIDHRLVFLRILLGIPGMLGKLPVPGRLIKIRI